MTDKLDICIPKVDLQVKIEYIKSVFEKLFIVKDVLQFVLQRKLI